VRNKFLRKLNLKFFSPVSQKYAADDTLDIINADDKKTLRRTENLFCDGSLPFLLMTPAKTWIV